MVLQRWRSELLGVVAYYEMIMEFGWAVSPNFLVTRRHIYGGRKHGDCMKEAWLIILGITRL
jgi:hypothetical protein